MKKIILSLSLLIAFSTSALAIDYETIGINNPTVVKKTNNVPNCETVTVEEADAPFDFDIKKYLPANFNAYAGMFEEVTIAEADEAFEFNTKDYLPENFDAYAGLYIDYGLVEEADEAFDFNTNDYLPVGFNAELNLDAIVEINIEEADEPFDFDTSKYLIKSFDAYAGLNKTEHTFLNCMSFPSL